LSYKGSALIDTVNGKLLFVTVNPDNQFKLGLFRCNLDGTACSHIDISAGQNASPTGSGPLR
jgi:hypothetical protein